MESNNGVVKTSDLGLAVYLYSLGAELTGIDRTDPRQAVFAFFLTPEQKEGIAGWQSGNAVGSLLAFWNAYRLLKMELHNKGDRSRDGTHTRSG